MRPVRLTMQAFGPYAAREVVDFREAVGCGLFGIYGPTGSGKSTIFSAMTFALFGEPAKAEQDASSLRSDHADPAIPTEVEFIFDLGDRRYVIRRRPEQMRPKQRGSGETKDAHEAWLFDATGLAVEDVTEARSGKCIAEKKIGNVLDALSEILGYGAKQFRQIVLLPQGKFEAFLAAKTDARLAILRELFDVSIYRRLAAKFKEDAAAAERQVRQEREVCAQRLRAENFESVDALTEGISVVEAAHGEGTRHETAAAAALTASREALDAGRRIEEQFQAADRAKAELDAFLRQGGAIQALRERVGNAQRARAVVDVERHFRDAEADAIGAARKRDEVLLKSETSAEEAQRAADAFESEKARSGKTDELRRRGEELERHLLTLIDAAGLEKEARGAATELLTAQPAFDIAARRCVTLSEQKRSGEGDLRLAREKEAERRRIEANRTALDAAYKAADDYEKAKKALEAARANVGQLKSNHAESVKRVGEARARFEAAEANLAAAQALHLAAKLVPGEACPVCGSLEHPIPATGRVEHAGLDKDFREAKAAWEHAHAAELGVGLNLASAEATQKEREDRLSELARPERSATALRAEIAAVARMIQALGPEIDISAAEARLAALEQEIAQAEAERDRCRGALADARQNDALAGDRLQQALSTIPEPLRQQNALDEAIAENRRDLIARHSALDAAEKAAAAAREAALAAEKDVQAAVEALKQAAFRRDRAREVFDARLAECGLTEDHFQSYKPLIATIDADIITVEEYGRKLDLARSNETMTRQAVAAFDRPDLRPLMQAVLEAEEAFRHATTDRAQKEARLAHLRNLQQEIAETLRRLDQAETESAALRELAACFNAENDQRLDLETFAIGAMFDQVLMAANLRLGPMTAGRYTLERDGGDTGGRGRRGLGIQVLDVYTGKARSPATLSGGETFIAALALALGLSDVVESVNGKVRLDTIFIDEGFGSLDTENESGTLDQVLQVLTDLVSQNRAVGLISHVPLVQEAIPNGFYVRKELQGSRVEARGAK